MEAVKLLGLKPTIQLAPFLCKHKMLLPVYRDIYPDSYSNKLLLNGEDKVLSTRAIRPERRLCGSNSKSFKKLLVSTTLLPKPIVDYILEKVKLFN